MKQQPKFKTPYNAEQFPDEGEVKPSLLPSETVPDQTMSIRTIVERYSKGLPVNATNRVPMYQGEEEFPDPEKLDLSERHEYMQQFSQEKRELEDRIGKRELEKEQKRLARQKDQEKKEEKPKEDDPK